MEYEAKSARDGAWYDVSTFLSHRSLETGDPEVLVRFAGFGAEEDEWVNVRKNVRQRSLPCESSECVAVLPADLILCFQEGKEQALYFDAHVLDAQRRRHDVRGCRCRFLVRYDHDQSEEIVALRKICRRPETDYRLQQLHAANDSLSANQNKNGANNIHQVSTLRVYPPAEVQPKQQHKVEPTAHPSPAEVPPKRQKVDSTVPAPLPEGPQRQLKVEPVVLSPPSEEVPENQHKAQPVLPDPSMQPSPEPQKVVEPMVPDQSDQASSELEKVEKPMEPEPTAQGPSEPLKEESTVPDPSAQASVGSEKAEAPLELDKVQSAVPDPSTEVSEPQKAETVEPSSGEVKQELQTIETNETAPSAGIPPEMEKVQPMAAVPSGQIPEEPLHKPITVTEPPPSAEAPVQPGEPKPSQKGSGTSGPSVEVPEELHQAQPEVPDECS